MIRTAVFMAVGLSLLHGSSSATPHVQLIERTKYDDGKKLHSSLLQTFESQLQPPAVEVKINGMPLWLVVDTGSADTFVYTPNTTCLIGGIEHAQAECAFGDAYTGSYEAIKDFWFAQTYGTQQVITGQFGHARVEVAGVEINQQTVAFAQTASANPFPGTSGILGLAPRGVEAAYSVADITQSNATTNKAYYSTVFETMQTMRKKIEAVFTLTLRRDTASYLTFGSTYPAQTNCSFVRTPLVSIAYNNSNANTNYYPIQPDGYTLNGTKYHSTFKAAVDSGTFISRLPTEIADTINAAFNPPAIYDTNSTFYLVSCNATIPQFGLTIGGQTFFANATDMLQEYGGVCGTSITRGSAVDPTAFPEGFFVLGDTFLNGVVAVFDVGHGEMRFAKR